jgi:hypothetical protein
VSNPELRRNLWLEMTGTRLAVMPIVLFGIFFLAWLGDERRLGNATASAATGLFVVLTWIWGAHLAAESVLSELRGRTWDWQRMSGTSPWSLAWGKLVGATAFAWYGAALCLAVLLLSPTDGVAHRGTFVGILVLGAILSQAIALLAALQVAHRDRALTRSQTTAWFAVAIVFLYPVFIAGFNVTRIEWYGLRFEPPDFILRSLVAFVLFALLGLWARVRQELRVRTLPLAWPGFVAFLLVWTAGFAVGPAVTPPGRPVAVALAVAAALTWLTAFGERKDPVALGRLVTALRADRWRAAAEEAPAWLLTLPFVLVLAALLVAVPFLFGGHDPWAIRWTVVAGVAFLLRDLALVHHLNLGSRPRRADLFAAVLLAIGYALLPLICGAAKWDAGVALFLPNPDHAGVSAASALAQATASAVLLVRRWRARARALPPVAPAAAHHG